MKQVLQNYRTGELVLADVPIPLCDAHTVVVKNMASLISIGTERAVIDLGKRSLIGKALARPDQFKRFIEKAKREGFLKSFHEALGRLDSPTPLGYSSAGIVVEAGEHVREFSKGDRVACIGAGYASHAEYISIPPSLASRLPDEVSFEEASFGMLGIIALHGIRCANLTFGASVAVIGLGLLGLLTVQLLKAYGCRSFGLDIDSKKADLAKRLGADFATDSKEELKRYVRTSTDGHGADAVIITAASKSDEPVNLAVDVSRFRGKIVLEGVADIHPRRNDIWEKEVEFMVSRAGGPGIFDLLYEKKGIDYPIGYVRWTETRNLQELLRLIAERRINPGALITHRFPIEKALHAYEGFTKGTIDSIGILLTYPEPAPDEGVLPKRTIPLRPGINKVEGEPVLGVIGAGLFGKALLLPAIKEIKGVYLKAITTSSGLSSYHSGRKYGFEKCSTDYHDILRDADIDAVLVMTPHSLHGEMVCEALQAGKHVFVEKPLCVRREELKIIISTYTSLITSNPSPVLMVGYNRRFSPHVRRIVDYLASRRDPMVMIYRVNPGFVSGDHWVHSEEEGGGRIIGEMCHFVDLMQVLTNSNPIRVFGERISGNNTTVLNNDNLVVNIKFQDGSVGSIAYAASGDKAFSRERLEIFCEGKTIVTHDFKETTFYTSGRKRSFRTVNQAMGYKEELIHFFELVKGNAQPNPEEIFYSTETVFCIHESLAKGLPVHISLPSSG